MMAASTGCIDKSVATCILKSSKLKPTIAQERGSRPSVYMNDDEKTVDDKQRKTRIYTAAITFLSNKYPLEVITTRNDDRNTYCYNRRYSVEKKGKIYWYNKRYFVKIFEDPKSSPYKISKKLFCNAQLKQKLDPYILLPATKPQKVSLYGHHYHIIHYPYINHCNLEELTAIAVHQKHINPKYHKLNPFGRPHSTQYELGSLKLFAECIVDFIALKDVGLAETDISVDNIIVPTKFDSIANNIDVSWFQLINSKNRTCKKVDNESIIAWNEILDDRKRIKPSNKPPEVRSNTHFDKEKAEVYQLGLIFIHVMFGQRKVIDLNGNQYWQSLVEKDGKAQWKKLDWNTKYLFPDWSWIATCIDKQPNNRPNLNQLMVTIKTRHKFMMYIR